MCLQKKGLISVPFLLPKSTKISACFSTTYTISFSLLQWPFNLISPHFHFPPLLLVFFLFVICNRSGLPHVYQSFCSPLPLASQSFLLVLILFLKQSISLSSSFSKGLWQANFFSHFIWNTIISSSLFRDCNSKCFSH